MLNARFTYVPESDNWSVSVYGENLGDKKYNYGSFAIGGYAHTSFFGNGLYVPIVQFDGQPRTLGASFRYNF